MNERRFGHSLMEELVAAQRDWNAFVAHAIEEEQRGNHEPMRLVSQIAREHVMLRAEERARERL